MVTGLQRNGAKANVGTGEVASSDELVDQATEDVAILDRYLYSRISHYLIPDWETFDDSLKLFKATQAGFTLSSVIEMVNAVEVFRNHDVLGRIFGMSLRTLTRRMRNTDERLTPEQSARALYFAQTLEKAISIFGGRMAAEEWLAEPAIGLDWEKPIDLLINSIGYEVVTDYLTRIEYGVY